MSILRTKREIQRNVNLDEKYIAEFEKIFEKASNNFRYQWGAAVFEKFFKEHPKFFHEKLLCRLGLLLDHLALKTPRHRRHYERKALQIYRRVLKLKSNSYRATWGIGRVWWHRRSRRALPYARKAFHLAKKENKATRGMYAQQVGLVYESLGDFKNAERWLFKGLRENPTDWGLHLNLVVFYRYVREFEKAKRFATRLQKLFKKTSSQFRRTAWGRKITQVIREADCPLPLARKKAAVGRLLRAKRN